MKPYLADPARCRAVLNAWNFTFRKKFGQNFLIREQVLLDTVEAAGITKDDFVLEIGPGIGTLTQYLADAAGRVLAVEIDRSLLPILKETLSGWDNVEVRNEDILNTDLRRIAEEENGGRPFKVAANLPYYITTPILTALFESGAPIESVTVMVQKEVAERIVCGPGSKAYGALSLAMQYYTEPELMFTVPPEAFVPRPNVESAVLRLAVWQDRPVKAQDEGFLFEVIRASFNQRRKKLVNGLMNFGEFHTGEGDKRTAFRISREMAEAALVKAGLSGSVRGETLTLQQFAALSDALLAERENGI